MAVALSENDYIYKDMLGCMISEGANTRKVRYNTTVLSLNPKIDPLGERTSERGVGAPLGRFFETYRFYLGKFEIAEQRLPKACVGVGATWQWQEANLFSDDTTQWQDLFILRQPKAEVLWYEIELARFIASVNLTVSYEVGQGTYSTVEGNQIEDTTTATFTATVSQQQRPNDLRLPGTPASAIYLEGYHTVPKARPDVPAQQRLSATLTNPNDTLQGEFILLPTVQSAVPDAGGRGAVVKGLFVVRGL